MSNDFYQRQAELEPFTTARSDDVRNELDAIQSGFEKLPQPRQDGTIGFLTPFTIVNPTEDNHPATNAQVKAENTKNTQQDNRLDNVENALTGLGPVDGRFTTLRYVATEGQTEIVLPSQFQSLAYVHKNGGRLYQTVGFNYDIPTKTITFTTALTLNDEVLVDVGMVPDAVLVDLIALQNDVSTKHSEVSTMHTEVTDMKDDVTTKHGQVDNWQQQVSQDKAIVVDAKNETNATYASLQALHLGSHATAPTTDNDGNPLQEGASYYNSTEGKSYVYEQGAWEITNLSSLTTVAKDSPTGKALLPVGTTAQGGAPSKGAVRYDDDLGEFVGGNGLEWGSIGGGGVSKPVPVDANTVASKNKVYAVDVADNISKEISIPAGVLAEGNFVGAYLSNWDGGSEVTVSIVPDASYSWQHANLNAGAKIHLGKNQAAIVQMVDGKLKIVQAVGENQYLVQKGETELYSGPSIGNLADVPLGKSILPFDKLAIHGEYTFAGERRISVLEISTKALLNAVSSTHLDIVDFAVAGSGTDNVRVRIDLDNSTETSLRVTVSGSGGVSNAGVYRVEGWKI